MVAGMVDGWVWDWEDQLHWSAAQTGGGRLTSCALLKMNVRFDSPHAWSLLAVVMRSDIKACLYIHKLIDCRFTYFHCNNSLALLHHILFTYGWIIVLLQCCSRFFSIRPTKIKTKIIYCE